MKKKGKKGQRASLLSGRYIYTRPLYQHNPRYPARQTWCTSCSTLASSLGRPPLKPPDYQALRELAAWKPREGPGRNVGSHVAYAITGGISRFAIGDSWDHRYVSPLGRSRINQAARACVITAVSRTLLELLKMEYDQSHVCMYVKYRYLLFDSVPTHGP